MRSLFLLQFYQKETLRFRYTDEKRLRRQYNVDKTVLRI